MTDTHEDVRLHSRRTAYSGAISDMVVDSFTLPGHDAALQREYLQHPGAVGIIALDADDRVLVINQYRHPVGMRLWEVPAGLLDVDGEPPHIAAARELAEEADLEVGRLDLLVEWFSSPGISDEALRVYVARDCTPVPDADKHERTGEERDIVTGWVPLDDVVDAVLSGSAHNPTLVVASLAAAAAKRRGWTTLRPADSPWPARPLPSRDPGASDRAE
ncbi:NUDIX domain-containing protein [Spelaeicoccus albus]|uniref:ADP-ribose pyrophosphatase n=1 Tax=Spelaeicoccus albus TaxID=1280376 RepID=A0A7Z0IJ28_9MICO|nr:NUDIX hydrolase [Spelaeicoccus albus]NYI69079.1 ADP-ribose pyrophosphatase [Spelaeicoccus albus]